MSYCWAKKQHRPRLLYNSALPKIMNFSTYEGLNDFFDWIRFHLCPSAAASDKTSGLVLVGPSRNGSSLEKRKKPLVK